MEISLRIYNSDLLKGTGLIQETLQLIDFYRKGQSKQELIHYILDLNALGKEHENRTKDIINHVFYQRYLSQGEEVILDLQELRRKYVSLSVLSQILLIYTCKANPILFDFIKDVYQPSVKRGNLKLPKKAALKFIQQAIADNRIPKKWSDSTKQKVSEHMNACLIDFKMIDRSKTILPFFLDDFAAGYWIHALHFKGVPDEAVITATEWSLFGFEKHEVLEMMLRISYAGHFVFQHSGDLVRISWKYKSMKEFLDGTVDK
jgi:hypothetical protein